MKTIVLLILALLVVAVSAAAERTLYRYTGSLEFGDATDGDGAYIDQFAVDVHPGSRVGVLVVSVDFSPELEVGAVGGSLETSSRGLGTAFAEGRIERGDYVTVRLSAAALAHGVYTVRVFELGADDGLVALKSQ